jgi:predicted Zn-dependent protease with MMP-like domain
MKRMSMKKFGRIVAEVMDSLPEELHRHLGNVVVDVEDEPDEMTLRQMGFTDEEIEEGESIYGLFVPMEPAHDFGETLDLADLPRRIIIYKLPLEEDFDDPDELLKEIRKTVIHEVAHHFGYSDEDLRRWTSVY